MTHLLTVERGGGDGVVSNTDRLEFQEPPFEITFLIQYNAASQRLSGMAFLAAMNAQDGKKADFAASRRGWTTDCHASSKQSMIDPGGNNRLPNYPPQHPGNS